jgi:hypothetical protein
MCWRGVTISVYGIPLLRCKALKWAIFDPFEGYLNDKSREYERLTRVYFFIFKEIDRLPGLGGRARRVRWHQEERQRLPRPTEPLLMSQGHHRVHLQVWCARSRACCDRGLVVNLVQDRRNVLEESDLFPKSSCADNLCSQIKSWASSRLHTCLRSG